MATSPAQSRTMRQCYTINQSINQSTVSFFARRTSTSLNRIISGWRESKAILNKHLCTALTSTKQSRERAPVAYSVRQPPDNRNSLPHRQVTITISVLSSIYFLAVHARRSGHCFWWRLCLCVSAKKIEKKTIDQ